jgi:hypothetical protein
MSTAAARHLEVRTLGPLARALIWRDSLGLFGGLCGDVDMVRRERVWDVSPDEMRLC